MVSEVKQRQQPNIDDVNNSKKRPFSRPKIPYIANILLNKSLTKMNKIQKRRGEIVLQEEEICFNLLNEMSQVVDDLTD